MKITIAFVAVMVLSFTGYNVYKTQKAIQLSDVAMANVEALADGEGTNAGYCYLEDTWSTKRGINIFAIVKLIKIQSIHVHLQWSLGGMMIISRIGVLNKVGL